MPLRIEKLFQEYNLPGSFAVASLLTLVAILTLIIKSKLEHLVASSARPPAAAESNATESEGS
jgi:sulfate transport system permease protein